MHVHKCVHPSTSTTHLCICTSVYIHTCKHHSLMRMHVNMNVRSLHAPGVTAQGTEELLAAAFGPACSHIAVKAAAALVLQVRCRWNVLNTSDYTWVPQCVLGLRAHKYMTDGSVFQGRELWAVQVPGFLVEREARVG